MRVSFLHSRSDDISVVVFDEVYVVEDLDVQDFLYYMFHNYEAFDCIEFKGVEDAALNGKKRGENSYEFYSVNDRFGEALEEYVTTGEGKGKVLQFLSV